MAKYRIESLNYIASGYGRTFASIDTALDYVRPETKTLLALDQKSPDARVVDENVVLEKQEPGKVMPVRADMQEDSEAYRKRLEKFAEDSFRPGAMYLLDEKQKNLEFNSPARQAALFRPMYDMVDVQVKSGNRIEKSQMFDMRGEESEDFYLPQLTRDPIGFCMAGDQTWMLTERTRSGTDHLHTSFDIDRGSTGSKYYTRRITGENEKTYVFGKQLEGETAQRYFQHERNIDGVEYNHLVALDHTDFVTDYVNGNVYGAIYNMKNQYSPTYSMDMSGPDRLDDVRDYTGIQKTGGKLYAKYYSGSAKDGRRGPQNVESIQVNQFAGKCRHKSYFYSVRLMDSSLQQKLEDSTVGTEQKDAIKKIKRDLVAAIGEICKNVAPAGTSLFDVQFES